MRIIVDCLLNFLCYLLIDFIKSIVTLSTAIHYLTLSGKLKAPIIKICCSNIFWAEFMFLELIISENRFFNSDTDWNVLDRMCETMPNICFHTSQGSEHMEGAWINKPEQVSFICLFLCNRTKKNALLCNQSYINMSTIIYLWQVPHL